MAALCSVRAKTARHVTATPKLQAISPYPGDFVLPVRCKVARSPSCHEFPVLFIGAAVWSQEGFLGRAPHFITKSDELSVMLGAAAILVR